MSKPNAWYGWKADKPDFRDHRLQLAPNIAISDHVDLRPHFPPCYNQGSLGSCTANAIAGLLEFNQRIQGKKTPFTPSRLYIYYREREMEGTIREDAGAEIRDGIKVVNKYGAPHESKWPYVINRFAKTPTKTVDKDALLNQSLLYSRLGNSGGNRSTEDIMRCLSSGFPFAFGFMVYKYFDSDDVAKSGILNMPQQNEADEGGHAVDGVGYTDDLRRVHSLGDKLVVPQWAKQFKLWGIVRNSWDTDWGDQGYFYIPFEYLTDGNLSDDYWNIRAVE